MKSSLIVLRGFRDGVGNDVLSISSYQIHLWSEQEDSSDTLQFRTKSWLLPVTMMRSMIVRHYVVMKVGSAPGFAKEMVVVKRNVTRSSSLLFDVGIPQIG